MCKTRALLNLRFNQEESSQQWGGLWSQKPVEGSSKLPWLVLDDFLESAECGRVAPQPHWGAACCAGAGAARPAWLGASRLEGPQLCLG